MADALFVLWDGGGNVNPVLALGSRLVAAGHQVSAMAPERLAPRFTDAGFGAFTALAGWWPGPDEVLAAIESERPDVVVVDFMAPDALCAALSTAVPVVALVHTRYRIDATNNVSMFVGAFPNDVAGLRERFGQPAVAHAGALLDECAAVLVVTTEAIEPDGGPLAPNVVYAGPILEDAGTDEGWQPPAGEGPLVVVGLGTTDMGETDLIQRTLDGLARLPVRVLVNVGDHVDRSALQAGANTTVAGLIRHAAVMPHADLFVTHCGHGGISSALSHGVPMVCLPLDRDQPSNAERVVALGAGVVLDPKTATPGEIATAVETVLAGPAHRAAARRIAEHIAADDGASRAVEVVVSASRS